MKELKQDLKNRSFKRVYLLYGDDAYLKRFYKNQLVKNIINDGDTMNFAHFDANSFDIKEIIALSDTMPFLSEYRLLLVENSNAFKAGSDELADYIPSLPDTTVLIFVEDKVEKRSRLFKAVSDTGYAAEINPFGKKELDAWIGGFLRKNNKRITNNAYELFLSMVGTNLENIEKELNKLVDYTFERTDITPEDVRAVCTEQMESKIFDMVDAIVTKQPKKALDLYYDLLTLKEPPMRILFNIGKKFNQLLNLKALRTAGFPMEEIARKTHMQDWLVRKNLNLAGRFSVEQLEECVRECVQTEEDVKTGKINDKLSLEIIISKFSNM